MRTRRELGYLALLSPASTVAKSSGVREAGGSVYLSYDLDPEALSPGRGWLDSAVFHTPACQFQNGRDVIRQDLTAMYAHGQRKIGTDLWHARLSGGDVCRGFLLNSSGGAFRPSVIRNLRDFVSLAGSIGFNEVQIRFAPLSVNTPMVWDRWRESLFQENLSVISSTIKALSGIADPKIIYDLGGELGGARKTPFIRPYVQRLWPAALRVTDLDHTYGFSIAYAAGKLASCIEWLRAAGPLPNEFAVDIYDEPYQRMRRAAEEARSNGIAAPVFIVQESYYNNKTEYAALIRGAADGGASIRTIMQWPRVPGGRRHISERATPRYAGQAR